MKHRNSSINGIHEVGSRVKFPAETFTLLRSCDFPRISHGRTIVFIWGGLPVRLFFYLVSRLYWATVFHSRVRTVYERNSNGVHQLPHSYRHIYPIIYLFYNRESRGESICLRIVVRFENKMLLKQNVFFNSYYILLYYILSYCYKF